jgi:hypothetical protein
MEGRDITVDERRDRDRWSQHVDLPVAASLHRVAPPVEAEDEEAILDHQQCSTVFVDDHGPRGQVIDLSLP